MQMFTRFFTMCLFVSALGSATAQSDTLVYYDFDGNLDGWTPTALLGSDNWVFSTVGPTGSFATDTIASTTAANGFALFDSDLLCTLSGQNARLASPMLNFTGETEVELRWQELYRKFQDDVFVDVSTDGGMSFVSIEVNAGVGANNFSGPNPTFQRLDISTIAAGQDSVVIGFRFQGGCDYAWQIDDVAISSQLTQVDVSLATDFFAVAPNYATPVSQLDTLVFVTDVRNRGGADLDLQVKVTVFEVTAGVPGTQLFTATNDYGTVPAATTLENKTFTQTYPMPDEVGEYIVQYVLLGDRIDENVATTGDTLEYTFLITEDLFAKSESPARTATVAGDNPQISLGAVYYVPNNIGLVQVDSVGFGASSVNVSNNGGAEAVLEVSIQGWKGDLNGDGSVDDDEIVELGLTEYTIDTLTFSNAGTTYVIPADQEDGSVELSDDYIGFITLVRYVPSPAAPATDDDVRIVVGNDRSYFAYSLATDSLGREKFAHVIETDSGFDYSFFGGLAPYAPSWISMDPIGTREFEALDEEAFRVSPNPASDHIRIAYDFGTDERVIFKVITSTGQQIRSYVQESIDQGFFEIPTAGLPNGLYHIQATTSDMRQGHKTVVVNH